MNISHPSSTLLICKIFLLIVFTGNYSTASAFTVTVVETGPLVLQKNNNKSFGKTINSVLGTGKLGAKKQNKNALDNEIGSKYPIALSSDVMCGKDQHMTRFGLGQPHAGLPFAITSKKMTRIKIRWDHPKKVLFPFDESKKTIVFPHQGGVSRLYFRAYQPITGNVYIMNDKNQVIKTCPYRFLPAKKYQQSISVTMNDNRHNLTDGNQGNNSNNIAINYRISKKTVVPEGGRWSFNAGASQSESSTNSRGLNAGFSYSW